VNTGDQVTRLLAALSNPEMMGIVVVLPAPLRPTNPGDTVGHDRETEPIQYNELSNGSTKRAEFKA
jgi:hypothetical protein